MPTPNERSRLRFDELADNPSPRVPICLALDVSTSMSGGKIDELNRALQLFLHAIERDEIASLSAEIAMVSFGDGVMQLTDFSTVRESRAPRLVANGWTPLGEAVELSLDLLDQAKKVYAQMGVDYYQPWLVLITDGQPTDNIGAAAARCRELVMARKLTVFPIGIGADADLQSLSQFSPKTRPIRLTPEGLPVFFEWLSKSTAKVSVSTPGDRASTDMAADEFASSSMSWESSFGISRK